MQSGVTAMPSSPLGPVEAREALVLVVDDYQDCREMYAAYLALAGFRVLKAGNGAEAVDIARRAVPDVVLMDLSLPGMDGCEATRQLKSDPRTRDVPVIALTAQNLCGVEDVRMFGFETLLTKPCLPDDLAREVVAVLRTRARRAAC